MANVIRIVAGLGGLGLAMWSAVRVMRARSAGAGTSGPEDVAETRRTSFAGTFAVLAATAVIVALTLLI